jgi:hypothetical protein
LEKITARVGDSTIEVLNEELVVKAAADKVVKCKHVNPLSFHTFRGAC